MTLENRINYVEFPAADFSEMKRFYGGVFNWTFEHYGEEYLAFNDGAMDGGFYLSEQKATAAQGAALVIFFANDLEATQAKIVAAGGVVCVPIFEFPGGRRFHFNDPHGNELAVWSDQGLAGAHGADLAFN